MSENRGVVKRIFKVVAKRYYDLCYGRWDVFEKTLTWFELKSELTEKQINEFKDLWYQYG